MTEINGQKIKEFASELAHKQVRIRKEGGKNIAIPAPVAIIGGLAFANAAVVASVAALAMGYRFSVEACEDPCEKKEP